MTEEVRIVDINAGRKPIAFEVDINCYASLYSYSSRGVTINIHLENKKQLEILVKRIVKAYKDYEGVKEDEVKKGKKLSIWKRIQRQER